MARTNNLTNFLTDVASAIKEKKGSEVSIPAANFDTEIRNLPSQGTYEDKSVTITQNGNTVVEPSENYDALSRVTINTAVPEKQLQTKNYTFTQNATLELTPDTGYDGFSSIGLTISTPQQDLSDATATPNSILRGYTAYNGTGKVTGTFYGAKLFETLADLQAYQPVADDNYGLIYGSELNNITATTKLSMFRCPATVTLPSAFTGSCSLMYRDDDWNYDANMSLSASSFNFRIYPMMGGESYSITYTSSDGITYTRTDSDPLDIELDGEIYCDNQSSFVDAIGYFVQALGYAYGGLYVNEAYTDQYTHYNLFKVTSVNSSTGAITTESTRALDYTTMDTLIKAQFTNLGLTCQSYSMKRIDDNHFIGYSACNSGDTYVVRTALGINTNGKFYFTDYNHGYTNPVGYKIEVDLENEICTITTNPSKIRVISTGTYKYNMYDTEIGIDTDEIFIFGGGTTESVWYYNTSSSTWNTKSAALPLMSLYRWKVAPTQFDATNDYVYDGKVFLGSAGVGTGTMASNPSLTNADAHVYGLLKDSFSNMEKVVITDSNKSTIKTQMRYWKLIPKLADGSSLLDTSGLTDGSGLFQYDNKMKH